MSDTNRLQVRNITACQALANMCAMELYRILLNRQTACSLYGQLTSNRQTVNPVNIAWLEQYIC